ncbi:visual pigment-like receptor peropsin [Glandiceps talaboti]
MESQNSNLTLPPNQTGNSNVNFSRGGYTTVAVFLGIIGVFGTFNNLLTIVAWAKNKSLRTPISIFLVNLNLGDFFVSVFATPLTFAANVTGRWLYGETACSCYAFLNAAAGVNSIFTLAVLSVERYLVIRCPLTTRKITRRLALVHVSLIWVMTLITTTPPFFGWGRYTPEGPGTSCSVNWESGKPSDVSYILFLFTVVLFIPLVIMVFCYWNVAYVVYKSSKRVADFTTVTRHTNLAKKETKVAVMVVLMVACFVICWGPYAVLSLYVAFGNAEKVTTTMAFIPSIVAKSSTVYNPIIYFALNKKFREAIIVILKCGKRSSQVSPQVNNAKEASSRISTVQSENHVYRSALNVAVAIPPPQRCSKTQGWRMNTVATNKINITRTFRRKANETVPGLRVEFVC